MDFLTREEIAEILHGIRYGHSAHAVSDQELFEMANALLARLRPAWEELEKVTK